MSADSSQVQKLIEAALDREPQLRRSWLRGECGGDEALLNAVLDFLDSEQDETIQVVKTKNDSPTTQPTQTHRVPAGRRIGPWQLVQRLGEGGMGTVWLAQRVDGELEMQASVKLVRPERVGSNFLARFRRERQIMADLKHPYIGTLLDAGTTEEGQPYLVMEYVDGDTLTRFCHTHVPELPQRIQLFRMICEAVAFAHRKGVIHRDIKPANIMVSKDGIPKLLDFGIAYLNDPAKDDDRLSRPGQVAMTPEYASPELYHSGVAGVASDIYALGLVLSELAVGRRPRDFGRNKWAGINNHLGDVPHLAELLKITLAERPDQRYGSVPELIEALDHAMGSVAKSEATMIRRFDALVWFHPHDADQAKELALLLEARHGLSLWLPGRDGDQPQTFLSESACLLICVGNGEPWHDNALRNAMEETISNQRVVPLLLGEARRPERESSLPVFLRRHTWIIQSGDSETLARAIRGLVAETPAGEIIDTCPFRGLEVFREEDRKFFFGREAMTQRLTEHIHRFLAVLGPSGSGKSSVVRAGLVPHLRQQEYAITLCTPSAHPLRELAFALCRIFPEQDPERLHQRLQAGDQALAFITRQLCEARKCERVSLIIDQFEEIFTLAGDQDEVKQFLACLFHAVEQDDSGLSIVVTLRSDFVGQCVQWPDLSNYLIENALQVEPMSREELRQAITEPARLAHLHFEEGLVDRILEDVGGASAELPLLEHALMELWTRRRGRLMTLAAYVEIGCIEGALAKRAEDEYQQLGEAEQQILRKMFTLCLVHPGEGSEDTRRRAAREDLLAIGGDSETSEALLQRFVAARLLTTQRDESQNTDMVDVAHEALIRKWCRIKTWMLEDRETAHQLERLRRRAKAWDEAGRDKDHLFRGGPLAQMSELMIREGSSIGTLEQTFVKAGLAQRRRKKQMAVAIGSLGFVLAAISFFLFIDTRSAKQAALNAKQLAEAEKTKAQQQTLEANYNLAIAYNGEAGNALKEGDATRAWLLSLKALSRNVPENQNLPEPRGWFLDPAMDDTGKQLWISPILPPLARVAAQSHGNFLALAGLDTRIRLINQETGHQEHLLDQARRPIEDLIFSPDDQWLAASSDLDEVYLWQVSDQSFTLFDKGHEGKVTGLAFSRDSLLLASGGEDGRVIIRNPTNKHILEQWNLESPINDLVFAEKQTLYIGSKDGLWKVVAGGEPQKLRDEGITDLAWCLWGYVGITGDGGLVTKDGLRSQEKKRVKVAASPSGEQLIVISDEKMEIWSEGGKQKQDHPGITDVVDVRLNTRGVLSGIRKNRQLFRFNLDEGRGLPAPVGHSDNVWCIAFSPDGKIMASGSRDGNIILWDSAGEQPPRVLQGHSAGVHAVAFSPDGARLASASDDQTVRLWGVADAAPPEVLKGHSASVWGVAFSPDGVRMASASLDQTIRIWDVTDAAPLEVLRGHTDGVNGVAFSPDGARLASASDDQTVRLWGVTNAVPPKIFRGHSASVNDVVFSPDGTRLASASYDQTVRLWGVADAGLPEVLRGHSASVNSVAFSPDGARLASTSSDQTVRLWDLTNGAPPEVFKGHSAIINGVVFSPDGARLASASQDQTVRLWDVTDAALPVVLREHSDAVSGVAFSPDGARLASASDDQMVRLWNVADAAHPKIFRGHSAEVKGVAFSPDGARLASASWDQTVRLWDVADAVPIEVLRGHSDGVSGVAFSPDGAHLASASWDETVRLWDVADAAPIEVLRGHSAPVIGVAFSPDGVRLASASFDQTVRLWDVADAAPLEVLRGHLAEVYGVAFSPDGTRLASTSADQTVRLWDVAGAAPPMVLRGHSGDVLGVTFSHDGRWLASSSADRTVRIWDGVDGKALAVLGGYEEIVYWSFEFSPNGKLLATPSGNQTVKLWHMVRFLEPKSGQPAQMWFGELLNRSLYHMGYRLDGFRLKGQPRMRLGGPGLVPSPYDHLDKPRPPDIPLADWLMQGYDRTRKMHGNH